MNFQRSLALPVSTLSRILWVISWLTPLPVLYLDFLDLLSHSSLIYHLFSCFQNYSHLLSLCVLWVYAIYWGLRSKGGKCRSSIEHLLSDVFSHFFNDIGTQHLGMWTEGEESRWWGNWVEKLGVARSQKAKYHHFPFSNHQTEWPQNTFSTIHVLLWQPQMDMGSWTFLDKIPMMQIMHLWFLPRKGVLSFWIHILYCLEQWKNVGWE